MLAKGWADGATMTPQDQGKAVELGELSDLRVEDLRGFYGLPDYNGGE